MEHGGWCCCVDTHFAALCVHVQDGKPAGNKKYSNPHPSHALMTEVKLNCPGRWDNP
jgi:hypothetical protein